MWKWESCPEPLIFTCGWIWPTLFSIGEVFNHKEGLMGFTYTERDTSGTPIGNVILCFEKPFADYVRSYFHGELCGAR